MSKWYEKCYARLLIDNHITEEDVSFMSRFEPAKYVEMVKKGGVDSSMVSACCHNGNCYYPTKIGHMHKNLNRRDIFGETIKLLRKEDIVPLAYYTVVFHNHAAKTNPSWRITDMIGKQEYGRYWHCCPNNKDYREFTKKQLAEIIAYDIEGIFIDMTFWRGVCVCPVCRERYLVEAGVEIPKTIEWNNPVWLKFQRLRQQWLSEFAQELTSFINSQRPDITVTHQFAPVLLGWWLAQSPQIAQACDYTAGDFYGGRNQQRLGTKVMAAFSKNIPYEWMTSRCVDLYDHTSTKSEPELMCSAATTLANGGAYFFIDAINPDGTLNDSLYELLGTVGKKLKPFKDKVAQLSPAILAETGLYFSMNSHVNQKLDKTSLTIMDAANNMSPCSGIRCIEEILGTSIVLNRAHIPYKIVTDQMNNLRELKTLIINDAAYMTKAEVDRIRDFVLSGGTLIATGMTSYYDHFANTSGDFELKDVFGVSYTGKKSKPVHYIGSERELVSCAHTASIVKVTTAKILAGLTEPVFSPDDPLHYASIHSNPPEPVMKYPGMTINSFGKGTCIYLCSPLLAILHDAQQKFGAALFKKYGLSGMLETNAPSSVEITILKGMNDDSFLICVVNYQQELPNIPVSDLEIKFKIPSGFMPKSCTCVSNSKSASYNIVNGILHLNIQKLETIEMIEIK